MDEPVQYLGFIFDGNRTLLRTASVARYYRKMRAGVRLAILTKAKHDKIRTGRGEDGGACAEPGWDALAARAAALSPARGAVVARPADLPLALVGERPDRAAWDRLVGLFAGAVGRGRLDKVVLARRVHVRSPIEIDVENALRRLAAGAPEGTIYAFVRGGQTFLGATPERLVRTAGRDFETVAIAGSTRRGATAAEDAALAAALMASGKEREEHAVVVEMLRDSLVPLAETLEIGAAPGILPLRDVQHLVTQARGRLRDRAGLLALAERLHPTPAVGGEPRGPALEMIADSRAMVSFERTHGVAGSQNRLAYSRNRNRQAHTATR